MSSRTVSRIGSCPVCPAQYIGGEVGNRVEGQGAGQQYVAAQQGGAADLLGQGAGFGPDQGDGVVGAAVGAGPGQDVDPELGAGEVFAQHERLAGGAMKAAPGVGDVVGGVAEVAGVRVGGVGVLEDEAAHLSEGGPVQGVEQARGADAARGGDAGIEERDTGEAGVAADVGVVGGVARQVEAASELAGKFGAG
ncbi:hypothetical protein [Streptomyces aureocirculatus]|uniref:hypothetical protein n=1 Tax=Streptomyces aureocirculatus TaxID=67275 RepID=UPI0012FF0F0E|nr:hypothetical protein [Streptomyces aureocirculatus]